MCKELEMRKDGKCYLRILESCIECVFENAGDFNSANLIAQNYVNKYEGAITMLQMIGLISFQEYIDFRNRIYEKYLSFASNFKKILNLPNISQILCTKQGNQPPMAALFKRHERKGFSCAAIFDLPHGLGGALRD